ncbi:hypothetical protein CDD80_3525 [Ophiocordyceps camponoti-rufipedis]|uniref:Uncharacterized protein n=1 Tax=Ophiocordyceps camponoti-rufipedis TaxID=2004952 RepID=A0A2C5YYP5_9HYPO|nr:hypothetical protein CDD80_3525 [Ophiocordyceps camponoti-rufipedis]
MDSDDMDYQFDAESERSTSSDTPSEAERADASQKALSGKDLRVAARLGHDRIVNELLPDLEPGAVDRKSTYSGNTALHEAASSGHVGLVNTLLKAGAQVSLKNKTDETPLHLAATHGDPAVIESLLENGASKDAKDSKGVTPLQRAVVKGRVRAVRALLECEHGETATINSYDTRTALYCAFFEFDQSIIAEFVKLGANLKDVDSRGQTLLHSMARHGKTEAVSLLLRLGARMGVLDSNGHTPMFLAAKEGHEEIFKILADRSLEHNPFYDSGLTRFLEKAIDNGSVTAVRFLLNAYEAAEPGLILKDERIAAAVGYAAKHHQRQIAEMLAEKFSIEATARALVEAGADVETRNGAGGTLLHQAVCEDNGRATDLLIELEADCNAKDKRGRTPLHEAVREGNKEAVKLLLAAGVDPSVRDDKGWTVFHDAAWHGDVYMLALLTGDWEVYGWKILDKHRKILDMRDNRGQTALHIAVDRDNFDVACMLINDGITRWNPDNNGQSSLHLAAAKGRSRIIQRLLAAGSDSQVTDKDSCTPYYLACVSGNQEAMAELEDWRKWESSASKFCSCSYFPPKDARQYFVLLHHFVKKWLWNVIEVNHVLIREVADTAPSLVPRIERRFGDIIGKGRGVDLAKLMLHDVMVLCRITAWVNHTGENFEEAAKLKLTELANSTYIDMYHKSELKKPLIIFMIPDTGENEDHWEEHVGYPSPRLDFVIADSETVTSLAEFMKFPWPTKFIHGKLQSFHDIAKALSSAQISPILEHGTNHFYAEVSRSSIIHL